MRLFIVQIFILVLILAIVSSTTICVNLEVHNPGNCYQEGVKVVDQTNGVYISRKNNNCNPLSVTSYWDRVRCVCDGPCENLETFIENNNYPAGTQIQLDGVIYQTSTNSNNEYPQPFLYNNPWKPVGTCYISCATAPIYQSNKIYHYNSIVKDSDGYLYISLQGWNNNKPQSDYGYQGASWLQIQQCIPQGVLQNYDITGKTNLVPCYENWYADITTDDELDACKGKSEYVLVGGYHSSNPNKLLVAAYGHSSQVLNVNLNVNLYGYYDAPTFDNGVYWYRYTEAFGFSDIQKVFLSQADAYGVFTSDPFTNTRLSWHLKIDGGWRLGTIIWLNSDYNYKKVIYLVQ